MYITRIYCRRRRDGTLFRFDSRAAMLDYSRANRESRRTLPVIERSEFIARKRRYENPTWVRSRRFTGMSMLREG